MTGPSALMGKSLSGIATLAKFKNIVPVFEDDHCEGKSAMTAYIKLRNQGIKLFYMACSGSILAVAPQAKQNGDLILTTYAGSLKIRETGDEVIRLNPDANSIAEEVVALVAPELRPTAILYEEQEYGESLAGRVKELLGTAVIESLPYRPDSTSFATEILKIKQRKPKSLVLIPLADGAARTILRQLALNKLDISIIGEVNLCDYPFKPSEFGLHGRCVAAQFKGSAYGKFLSDYTSVLGHPPAYPFYDAMALDLFERLDQIAAEPATVSIVKSKILGGFNGKFASYRLSPDGESLDVGKYLTQVEY